MNPRKPPESVLGPVELMEEALRSGELPRYSEIQGAISRSLYDIALAPTYRNCGEPVRGRFASRFGYGVPCLEAIEEIAKHSPLVEVGAGNGFWTYWLRKAGCDVVATDGGEPDGYTRRLWVDDLEVRHGGEAVCQYPDRNVLMVWPRTHTWWPAQAIQAMKGSQTLCYVGEGPFGVTAHVSAFSVLDSMGFHLTQLVCVPNWPLSAAYLAIYSRAWGSSSTRTLVGNFGREIEAQDHGPQGR